METTLPPVAEATNWKCAAPRRSVRGLFSCLECGCDEMEAVSDGDMTNFICTRCHACWHYELGEVTLVHPLICPGCPYQARCFEELAARE